MNAHGVIGLVALPALLQAAQPINVPEPLWGVWFASREGQAVGVERIDVQYDGAVLWWRGERAPCSLPAQTPIIDGAMSAVLLTCRTATGTARVRLTRPSGAVLIVHLVAPGSDNMSVFVSVRGAQGAPTPMPAPSAETMPQFPWPPPHWTSRLVLPDGLAVANQGESLGTIFNRLRIALGRASISEWSVYALGVDGFAIVARIENIEDDGRPAPARFGAPAVRSQAFSLADYIKGLFRARPGRYRVIALVVTARPVTARPTPADRETLAKLLASGAGTLSDALSKTLLPPSGHCEALVYEFFRPSEDDTPAQVLESRLSAVDHLFGAGLWRREELGR